MTLSLVGAWASAGAPTGEGQPGFLKPGDRWVFVGDSITHNDTYRQKVERIFRHFHPDVPAAFAQWGVSGVSSEHRWEGVATNATVVSIMLGMNNFINGAYAYGMDAAPFLDAYRRDMQAKVQQFRDASAVVLLLSPTLTDPRFDHGLYELRGGEAFLKACAGILREIAARTNGVFYVPVQEEFEAFEQVVGPQRILRLDGVHPSGLGQCQIARTLWEHLNLAGPATAGGERRLSRPAETLPITARLVERMLTNESGCVTLALRSPAPLKVTATWSAGKDRGRETLELTEQETAWTVPLPASFLALKPGEMTDLVVDFAAGDRRSLFLIDLSCVPVLHMKDGTCSGAVETSKERTDGKRVANWEMAIRDKGLLISGEVFDSELNGDEYWPWGRDGVNIWLDWRPAERFAGIGVDEDVHMTLLKVMEKPRFTCTLIPWVGRGMHLAADAGGERTASGYRWSLFVHRCFTRKYAADIGQRDFVGFNLIVADSDKKTGGGNATAYYPAFEPQGAIDKYPNALMLVDLKNKLACDSAIHVHLFGR